MYADDAVDWRARCISAEQKLAATEAGAAALRAYVEAEVSDPVEHSGRFYCVDCATYGDTVQTILHDTDCLWAEQQRLLAGEAGKPVLEALEVCRAALEAKEIEGHIDECAYVRCDGDEAICTCGYAKYMNDKKSALVALAKVLP